jgi:hypothetical protein
VTPGRPSGDRAGWLLGQLGHALGPPVAAVPVRLSGGGSLPSAFAVSDLAQTSMAVAGQALAALVADATGGVLPAVTVDRDLASAWFLASIRPQGWTPPPVWDPLAGDYPTGDGWIRLHTNAPHHRVAALSVLDVDADRQSVSTAVTGWRAEELETAVVAAGGAAAALRTLEGWAVHPQGRAVAGEPLLHVEPTPAGDAPDRWVGTADRPLAGVRVLDLTRVLAGPVATRLLAGWGAEVLRIDPPWWEEPSIVPEVTLGKRCARLDLRSPDGRDRLLDLLTGADVLVHGYRADALDGLGLGVEVRHAARPGLVDVSLDAYGWSGPWAERRGFDSLVQMSAGIADAGRRLAGADPPVPLPVQALDHAAGYLMAAACLRGLALRLADGAGSRWRTSLARVARLLVDAGLADGTDVAGDPAAAEPVGPVERTVWGDALRLAPAIEVDGAPLRWSRPAGPLGADRPHWERG